MVIVLWVGSSKSACDHFFDAEALIWSL